MKFVADEMLGKLAKWLRIVGCDVVYKNNVSDSELVDCCRKEGRVLLTRDTRLLAEHKDITSLLIASDHFREQTRQVLKAFAIDPHGRALSRCLRCNQILVSEDKQAVKDIVPPYVLHTQDEFWRCPGCQRLYWPGTHHQRMLEELQEMVA
jgi:uncharacterized protein with PIN domain